jgi:Flp pilus assembly protein TadG
MSELNGNGVLGKTRTVISICLLLLAVAGIVYASGGLTQRVQATEAQEQQNAAAIKQLDDKKADKREIDDIHKQLDRIEGKLDRRR